jgi:putative Mg2+ transporter-C (MgtC) family protein
MSLEPFAQGASISEVVVRLLVAVVAGGLIGWDRERLDKPAGLRTHMLVSLGSCAFTLLGFEVSGHLAGRSGLEFDPTRVLQGVVGGIGFLGAGTIIQSRGHVSGITTAASVWVAGALGATAGVGAYLLTAATAVLAFVILIAVGISHKLSKHDASDRGRHGEDGSSTPPSEPSRSERPRSRSGEGSPGGD